MLIVNEYLLVHQTLHSRCFIDLVFSRVASREHDFHFDSFVVVKGLDLALAWWPADVEALLSWVDGGVHLEIDQHVLDEPLDGVDILLAKQPLLVVPDQPLRWCHVSRQEDHDEEHGLEQNDDLSVALAVQLHVKLVDHVLKDQRALPNDKILEKLPN